MVGRAISEDGVEPPTVVVGFDIGEQVAARLVAAGVAGMGNPFGLQRVEPALPIGALTAPLEPVARHRSLPAIALADTSTERFHWFSAGRGRYRRRTGCCDRQVLTQGGAIAADWSPGAPVCGSVPQCEEGSKNHSHSIVAGGFEVTS